MKYLKYFEDNEINIEDFKDDIEKVFEKQRMVSY